MVQQVQGLASLLARRGSLLLNQLTPIPVEVSSTDTYSEALRLSATDSSLEPITAIVQLQGSDNLGTLLWAFVLYQGIFPQAGRPADWILTPLAKALGASDADPWFKDMSEGFSFDVPPFVEAFRVALFLAVGYLCDILVVKGFDNDSYWGWAIAGSLTIPVGLIALARGAEPRYTREMAALETKARLEFDEFAAQRLSVVPETITVSGQRIITKIPEKSIIAQFRRTNAIFRDESLVTDKMLIRVVRAKIGRKPTKEGDERLYYNIGMSNLARDAKLQLAENLRKAEEARAQAALELQQQQQQQQQQQEIDGDGSFQSEFARK